ncbi:2-C-methyl-D-erythritol 4-phosphate cytidylyltransferase [Mangrovimicrobium sediminis]|uniref:2-C-methyl-D-erythritol 4-phosphate cytidylyltransferase n=1 Tax=Mangrovimicrobium sediminis TaxID=2562682 RepID=A0A4Z0M9K6_9GAMM|nr:2-C-methyl-D-erythritol 4-phosphate cytidylyltransferase [Haliea sp. SAOS-164]TGD76057.1 2-C-methyl-D-erythritol 4-phosphate cytidylyltransferase [Haliea sp. SAOS-164]
MSGRCHAVVPAAGVGTRMGSDIPKQYLRFDGVTLLEHSVNALLRDPRIESVTVAVSENDTHADTLPLFADPRVQRVTGGAQRADSVLAGLRAVPGDPDDWVLVHDAARPGLPEADLARLIDQVLASQVGGILAEAIVDTVKYVGDSGLVEHTLDRSRLWCAQTPQMFRLGELGAALEGALAQGLPVTDEASAMEHAGLPVQLVPGSPANFKVTAPDDLALAAWYLAWKEEQQ